MTYDLVSGPNTRGFLSVWVATANVRFGSILLKKSWKGLRRFNAPSTSRNLILIADDWEIQFRIEADVEQELATASNAFSIGTVASDFFNSIGHKRTSLGPTRLQVFGHHFPLRGHWLC